MRSIDFFQFYPWHQGGEEHLAVVWGQRTAKKTMELLDRGLTGLVMTARLQRSTVAAVNYTGEGRISSTRALRKVTLQALCITWETPSSCRKMA
jgi:hypothetical protein